MRELVENIAETTPRLPRRLRRRRLRRIRDYRVSCEKAASVFGYATTWDARRSAGELDEAQRALGLTTEEFEGTL